MATCPSCQGEIEEDFGLVTCPHCNEAVMLGMEGDAESAAPVAEEKPFEEVSESVVEASEEVLEDPAVYEEEAISEEYSFENYEEEPQVIAASTTNDEEVSSDLSEVAEYGNSPESSGVEGTLRYDIRISGIDSPEVRNDFKEALIDARLIWDVEEILEGLENGSVEIKNVSAVKASIVVNRIKTMPISIEWTQKAIHQV